MCQWVISRGSTPGAGISYGSAYFGPVTEAKKAVKDPTLWHSEGILFYEEQGGYLSLDALPGYGSDTVTAVTKTAATLGQHGTGVKWIVAAYSPSESDPVDMKLSVTVSDCDILECAPGFYLATDADAYTGCSESCKPCADGYSSIAGFTGCYWDADQLEVSIGPAEVFGGGTRGADKGGIYTNEPTRSDDSSIYIRMAFIHVWRRASPLVEENSAHLQRCKRVPDMENRRSSEETPG